MKKNLVVLIAILTLSCTSGDTIRTSKTALTLVTGIDCRQTLDDIPLSLGNANTLVNNKFLFFPNPVVESIYIISEQTITDVWIVAATPEKIYQNTTFSNILNPNLYSEQTIVSKSSLSLVGQSTNEVSFNLSSLNKGYYRIFVKIGGEIYWDNLYKYSAVENNQAQFEAITNFWN